MPIELRTDSFNIKVGDTYIPIGLISDNSHDYASPEMYGAIGDGVSDDTSAWQEAVDSGKNVIAFSNKYKCGTIEISKNISINCNGADFKCTGQKLFVIKGSVKQTLTGQLNYSANQVGYQLTSSDYANYTGFAMLQGTNNFDESRTYYYGGFVCYFNNGVMEGSYPVDAENGNDNLKILLIDPVTVHIENIGNITHMNSGTNYSIEVLYGYGCSIENVKADSLTSYTFINLLNCLKCSCKSIKLTGFYGETGTNSYVISFNNSSYCSVVDSHIYNKYWHCITTGGNYLCYRNLVENCVLLNDTGYAYCDHDNGVGTIIRDCTIAGVVIGTQSFVDNVIVLSLKDIYKNCVIVIESPTDHRLSGVAISNIQFVPDEGCLFCGLTMNSYPQETGKTFYYDNIKVNKTRVISETVIGKIIFGFASSTSDNKNFVIGKLIFNDCDMTIDLTCTNPYADTSNMVAKRAVYETI